MLLKIIGSLAILGASTFIGHIMSRDYSLRPHQLRELQGAFQMMENEIAFMANILKDALLNVSSSSKGVTAIFFKETANLLENNNMNAMEAWTEAVDKSLEKTALNQEDQSILRCFGKILGTSDFDGQIRNIRLTITQLKVQEEKAEEDKKKNESMYKSLGILGGLALVIILF